MIVARIQQHKQVHHLLGNTHLPLGHRLKASTPHPLARLLPDLQGSILPQLERHPPLDSTLPQADLPHLQVNIPRTTIPRRRLQDILGTHNILDTRHLKQGILGTRLHLLGPLGSPDNHPLGIIRHMEATRRGTRSTLRHLGRLRPQGRKVSRHSRLKRPRVLLLQGSLGSPERRTTQAIQHLQLHQGLRTPQPIRLQ